jgi:Flp pilus assembly protein CpaB
MKKNLVPLLGIAFVVAILATGLFYGLFINRLESRAAAPSRQVVVANRTLQRGTVVSAEDLRRSAWPGDGPKDAISGAAEAIGQTVLQPIAEGEPLLTSQVSSRDHGPGGLVPAGMRVVSVHVADSSGIVSLLQPGFRVDVQVVSSRGQSATETLRTILQNIEVLNTATADNSRPVVNLLVRPAESDLVGLADSTARVRLALRNPTDGDDGERPAVSMANLLTTPSAPRRAARPAVPVGVPSATASRPKPAATASLR